MIELRTLRRIRARVQRSVAELNAHYQYMPEETDPVAETMRNLDTAIAQLDMWIAMREQSRKDR